MKLHSKKAIAWIPNMNPGVVAVHKVGCILDDGSTEEYVFPCEIIGWHVVILEGGSGKECVIPLYIDDNGNVVDDAMYNTDYTGVFPRSAWMELVRVSDSWREGFKCITLEELVKHWT